MDHFQPNPSRRTLVKGLAWLVPAVTVMASAPVAVGASPQVGLLLTAGACRYPGTKTPWTKTFRTNVTFSNSLTTSVDISITAVRWRGFSPTFPGSGSIDTDYFFDPQHCDGDGADADLVADNCGSFDSAFNFPVAPQGSFSLWVFWRGISSGRGDLCFDFIVDDGFSSTQSIACTNLKFGPDCGCSTPQPPYPKNKAGC
jgi:hypothetical protein